MRVEIAPTTPCPLPETFVVLVLGVAQGFQKVAIAAGTADTCGFAGDAPRVLHAGLGLNNAFYTYAMLLAEDDGE